MPGFSLNRVPAASVAAAALVAHVAHLELLGVCLSLKMMQSLLSSRPRLAWPLRPSAAEPACGEQHGGEPDCLPETGVPVSGGAKQLTNTRL